MSAIPIYARGQKDTGVIRKGKANEDNFYDGRETADEKADLLGRLYIVADGIGGSKGGRRASTLATTHLPDYYYASQPGDTIANLTNAIMRTAKDILHEAQTNPELSNMGCTLVATVIQNGKALIAYLGDARVYLLRTGATIQQLTVDHSWVQEQVSRGTITPEEARVHPNRNVITKSLGSPRLPEPSIVGPFDLALGDQMLLCSDGLCGVVPDETLAIELQKKIPVADKVQNLINQANANGGPDNISVVVVYAGDPAAAPTAAVAAPGAAAGQSQGGSRSWMGLVGGLLALVVVAGLAFLFMTGFFGGDGGETIAANSPEAVPSTGSEAAVSAPEDTATPAPTETLSAVIVATDAIAATATDEVPPTSTMALVNTSTPAPTQTATPTRTPRPTIAASFTPASPAEAISDSTMVLLAPLNCDVGSPVRSNQNILFEWEWPGELDEDQYLEVRVRGISQGRINADARTGDQWQAIIPAENFADQDGEVRWRVFLMQESTLGSALPLAFSSNTGCMNIISGGGTPIDNPNNPEPTRPAENPIPDP